MKKTALVILSLLAGTTSFAAEKNLPSVRCSMMWGNQKKFESKTSPELLVIGEKGKKIELNGFALKGQLTQVCAVNAPGHHGGGAPCFDSYTLSLVMEHDESNVSSGYRETLQGKTQSNVRKSVQLSVGDESAFANCDIE